MSNQDILKALSSFGQVDNRLSQKYEGISLSLSLTKKLIEPYVDGKCDLQSSNRHENNRTITFEYTETIEL